MLLLKAKPYMRGDFTVLSRKDKFANLEVAKQRRLQILCFRQIKRLNLNNSNYDGKKFDIESDKMPKTNANNKIKLADLRELDHDDEARESLLDNLSFDDMSKLVALGDIRQQQ